jgi:hypothetical protein
MAPHKNAIAGGHVRMGHAYRIDGGVPVTDELKTVIGILNGDMHLDPRTPDVAAVVSGAEAILGVVKRPVSFSSAASTQS